MDSMRHALSGLLFKTVERRDGRTQRHVKVWVVGLSIWVLVAVFYYGVHLFA
jgi:hypothetical protein